MNMLEIKEYKPDAQVNNELLNRLPRGILKITAEHSGVPRWTVKRVIVGENQDPELYEILEKIADDYETFKTNIITKLQNYERNNRADSD